MMYDDDPALGREIDGFKILAVLGRGGMGIVYKAEDTALSRTVALKMVDRVLASDPAFVHRFQGEARALARIDSPYIVGVHALRSTEAGLFIVMEFVDGGTLHDLPSPYPWRRALPLARQMLTALEHAHGVGIIHRDIKPQNIMLSKAGTVKVADFGLAKLVQGDGRTTMTQGIAGTLFYMSPEQVKGLATLDHRSDLYSLGMTLYELIAGRLPLDREASEFATMRAIVEQKLPPPSKFRPDIPPGLDAVVMRALEKDPARRYQNAAEMRAAFEAFENNTQPEVVDDGATVVFSATPFQPAPSAGTKLPAKPPVRRPVYVAAATAAVLVGLASGYMLLGKPGAVPAEPVTAATLTVASMPAGAALYLNGDAVGTTPVRELEVEGESATLRVELPGYAPRDTFVTVEPGQALALDLRLDALVEGAPEMTTPEPQLTQASQIGEPARPERTPAASPSTTRTEPPKPQASARLALRANGSGALKIMGNPVASGAASQVPADTPIWVACGEGRYETAQQVRLSPNDNREFTCHFQAKVSVQTVAEDGSTPWGAVFVNGMSTDAYTPNTMELPPGTYRIGARRDGWISTGDETIVVKPSFEPKEHRVVIRLRQEPQ